MKKIKGWELRKKRQESTVEWADFPFKIRTKPTNHKQYCYHCRCLIDKGQRQIMINSGMWLRYKDSHTSKYSTCKSSTMHNMKCYNGLRTFTRYIYLHANCCSCVLNRLFQTAGLSLKPNCEACEARFNCYTGNLEERHGTYIPSRLCEEQV